MPSPDLQQRSGTKLGLTPETRSRHSAEIRLLDLLEMFCQDLALPLRPLLGGLAGTAASLEIPGVARLASLKVTLPFIPLLHTPAGGATSLQVSSIGLASL